MLLDFARGMDPLGDPPRRCTRGKPRGNKFKLLKIHGFDEAYILYRQGVGKAILLGLEFLVAGDIIRTVAVSPNLTNVIILGCIVLIRTFLSFALQHEIEKRWPWQTAPAKS